MLWFFLALTAAVFIAIYFMEVKKLVSSVDKYVACGIVFSITGILFFSLSLMKGIPEIGSGFVLAVCASVLMNIIATPLYFHALKTTDLSLAVPMIAFTPIFLIFTSSLILGESPHPDGTLGILLVVGGLMF